MAESTDLIANLARSGRMRIAAALAVTALVGGGLGVIMLRGGEGDTALLFSGLDLEEAAEIAGRLDTANIRYNLEGGGSAIFVDRAQVDDARMMLSEQGLPTRGSVGWEIFDKTEALGTTSFVQNINKIRALEGELARTISSLDMVKAARVHLNLPDRPLFQKDNQPPTASVVLSLRGSEMGADKVRAIRNLVATSVPGLEVKHITVVDDQGRMLAAGAESSEDALGGGDGDERKVALENNFRNKVSELVENIAGPGAARVQVSAEVDYNRITESAETYDPEGQVLRSSTSVEETSSDVETEPGDETTVANNVPDGADPAAATELAAPPPPTSQRQQSRTDETVNYEISKSTRTEIIEGGRIQKISVAVVVDDRRVPGVEGAPATFEPRTPEELQRISTLVKSAIGFNEARGDTVTVENISFARPEVSMVEAEEPGAFDFDKFDLVRGGEIGALLITALALVFFVLRPLVRGLLTKPEDTAPQVQGRALAAPPPPEPEPELDMGIDVARVTGQVRASTIKRVGEVVNQYPDESSTIIRTWLLDQNPDRAA
jgi:flagellar M-ring protein FliF